jgi:type II secretory pathway pseudopilin PulG
MNLRGQSQNGYAMAALLVAMSVMAVLLSVAMPVWNRAAQREKEAELIFRGEQYARAIGLFQQKYANTPPPDLDVLVRERFLRKKYTDPITGEDFVAIPAVQAAADARGRGQPGRGSTAAPTPARGAIGAPARGSGVIGVTSASTEPSIRIYNGGTRYNEWRFVYAPPTTTPGAGAPGTATPGQPIGPTGPPGRGGQPPGGGAGPGRGGPGPGGPARGGTRGLPNPAVTPGVGR